MLFSSKKEFKKVFLDHYEPLCNYANNTLNNMANAEDVVQEVFLHLWESRSTISIPERMDQYLFKAVKNKMFEFVRARKSYEKHKQASIETKLSEGNISDISNIYMKLEQINSSLRHLPPKCRNVFVMHKFNGLTYGEIAEVEKISVKTVENHMLKAIKILRSKLK